jgi:membrane protein DedA with SNARE-associated domain
VFDQFTLLVSDASGWAYAIVLLLALLDALVPLVPSETSVITAGVVASSGDLNVGVIVLAAAAGAFAGDNAAYTIGRRYGSKIEARFFRSARARERTAWAERQLAERGSELIFVARFIPGGRTAVTLSAGTLRFSWHRFVLLDGAAALGWALYATFLGYFGGRAFEHAAWKGLLVALGIAFAVAALIELARWILKRRRTPDAATGPSRGALADPGLTHIEGDS